MLVWYRTGSGAAGCAVCAMVLGCGVLSHILMFYCFGCRQCMRVDDVISVEMFDVQRCSCGKVFLAFTDADRIGCFSSIFP